MVAVATDKSLGVLCRHPYSKSRSVKERLIINIYSLTFTYQHEVTNIYSLTAGDTPAYPTFTFLVLEFGAEELTVEACYVCQRYAFWTFGGAGTCVSAVAEA